MQPVATPEGAASRPKTALVTGAANRIGRAIAEQLADHGWRVAIHYHSSIEAADKAVEAIRVSGGEARAFAADLMRDEDTETLFRTVGDVFGSVNALINNASTFEKDDLETATRDTWDLHMQVNLRAPFILTQAFANALPAGWEGAVVNIIDQRVWNLPPDFTTYTLSKAGLWALTQTLALALSPRIRVNAVAPGPALPSARQTERDFQRQYEATPLKRPANPRQIADAVRYLLDAPAVTGQMIAVDSGQHLCWAPPSGSDGPRE